MSQNFFHIPALLTAAEIQAIELLLNKAEFVDGRITANMAARDVKNNMQMKTGNETIDAVHSLLHAAIQSSPLFSAAAMPKEVYPFIISKYTAGKYYGWHVDSPVMGHMRTDMAMTVFLSDPSSYEGGELLIQSDANTSSFKPAKGDAVLYPCQYIHCVNEIESGERLAAVTWIQSHVKNTEQRQILYQLRQVHASLYQQAPHAAETNQLLQTHSNLFRMWAEV